MKLNIFLVLAVIASASAYAGRRDTEKNNNLIQEWKEVYGKYGYETYYPLQYRLTRYSYPKYPVVQPGYPVVQPGYPVVQPGYPVVQPGYPVVQPGYPVVQPGYPVVQPSYQVVQPSYPIIQPVRPYPSYPKPITTYPVRVKTSYNPEYFNRLYGYYPKN